VSRGGISDFVLSRVIARGAFQERAQLPRTRRVASLRSALAFDLAIRSRVTANRLATSSSVCSLPSSRPKRILMTFSSRGVNVFSTEDVVFFKFKLITASDGETTGLVLDEVAKMRIFSSPIGVSAKLAPARSQNLAYLDTECPCALAISSLVGFRARVPARAGGWCVPICDRLDHVHRNTDGVRAAVRRSRVLMALPNSTTSRTLKTCTRGATRTCPPPSSEPILAFLESGTRNLHIRGWCISWRVENNQPQVGFDQFLLGFSASASPR